MAKTITISLTDELYTRLQDVKEEFNVSKLCQEALLQKVRAVETSKKGDLIEFLRIGKWEAEVKYRDMGREWAETAILGKEISYKVLVELAEEHEEAVNDPNRYQAMDVMEILWSRDISVPEYKGETDIFADEPEEQDSDPMFNEEVFVRGYIEKAWEIWESVKDKL